MAMGRPIIGVICNSYLVDGRLQAQAVGDRNLRAIIETAECAPILIPAMRDAVDIESIADLVDGVVLAGGRANVHPSRFGVEPNPKHEPYDDGRDSVALALVRACVDLAIPLFGVCRGLQEMNVAFGGSLHPEVGELPGRMNHRAPRTETGDFHPDPAVVFAERHDVALTTGGVLERILGAATIRVNSLHGQCILKPGERIAIEGVAEDGTIEAISVKGAAAFAVGVQWHAEYDTLNNRINGALFSAFGAAADRRRRERHAA